MNNICQACGYERDLHKPEGHKFVPQEFNVAVAFSNAENQPEVTTLEQDIASVLNKHSAENGSNTPDFILAEYLTACLKAYNVATKSAHDWRGVGYLNVGIKDT